MAPLASRYRRPELDLDAEQKVAKAVLEGEATEPRQPASIRPEDPWRRRGVPVVGRGTIGSAIPGTDPEAELLRRAEQQGL